LALSLFDNLQKRKNEKSKDVGMSVNLNFLKSVTTNQIIEAFNGSFQGCNQKQATEFLNIFRTAIGTKGLFNGETIEFWWLRSGGLLILINGEVKTFFLGDEIEKRLIEAYVDPKRTVSPGLCVDVISNLSKV
jgi:hypothetical protein